MYTSIYRLIRKCFVIALAVTVGLFIDNILAIFKGNNRTYTIAQLVGLTNGKGYTVFRPPLSLSPQGIIETTLDTNSDGKTDLWSVEGRKKESFSFAFTVLDRDHDSRDDSGGVNISNLPGDIGVDIAIDKNLKSIVYRWTAALEIGGKIAEDRRYIDFGMDGGLDSMFHRVNGEVVEYQIHVDGKWYIVIDIDPSNELHVRFQDTTDIAYDAWLEDSIWVKDTNGLVLKDGKWVYE